ncbi:hypothetical protein Peur_003425 [Populus x canadensis]
MVNTSLISNQDDPSPAKSPATVKSCLFRSHDEQLDITCRFSRNISINVKRKQEPLSSCLNKIGAIIASGANSIRRRSLHLPSKR